MLPDPEVLADQILEVTGQRRPPTDVRAIVGKWSQLSVVETDLDGDGFFVDLGEIGGEILLKKNKQETRKRFTLAHELGHFLVRHHIQEHPKKQDIENWCNNFAAAILLPKLMLSRHLKSGGLTRLTERLREGPAVFQVSEKAFYVRITRLFPISIINLLFSKSAFYVTDEYHSQQLKEWFGNRTEIWNAEFETFLMGLADADVDKHQLKLYDRNWLAHRLYKDSKTQKFMLVLLER
jgi:Zn-dependent peptidase ImmA (M78 family)